MRYFPQRARRRIEMDNKLRICTYCLGDLFADGRCVQCHARIAPSAWQPMQSRHLAPQLARVRPALN